jgi:hypothetical protein
VGYICLLQKKNTHKTSSATTAVPITSPLATLMDLEFFILF